jgi:hypothetical protein
MARRLCPSTADMRRLHRARRFRAPETDSSRGSADLLCAGLAWPNEIHHDRTCDLRAKLAVKFDDVLDRDR